MDVPYDPDTRGTLYRVDAFNVDGGARDDIALVVFDVDGEPIARQIFADPALHALMPREPGELTPADWLRDVIDAALNSDGRDTCDDCGNRYDGARPYGGHALDCDYADN